MVDFIGIERIRELLSRRGAARFIDELCARDRERLPALERVREVAAPCEPLERRSDRAHARLRRPALCLQVREWPPEEHRRGAAHRDRLRRAGGRRHRLPAALVGADAHDRAADRGHLGAGGAPHGPPRQPRDGADRQRRSERVSDDRLPPPARHPRAASLRYRCARHREAGTQPLALAPAWARSAPLWLDGGRRRRCATSSPR